jgi:hypothetical protein
MGGSLRPTGECPEMGRESDTFISQSQQIQLFFALILRELLAGGARLAETRLIPSRRVRHADTSMDMDNFGLAGRLRLAPQGTDLDGSRETS